MRSYSINNNELLFFAFTLFLIVNSLLFSDEKSIINWHLNSADISLKNDEITINTNRSFIRAVSNVYKGEKWEFSYKFIWMDGKIFNAGAYFGYWHPNSTFFLETTSFGKIYIKRIFEFDNNEYHNFKETPFQIEKNRWYKVTIIRKNENYKVTIDDKLVFDFNESSSYNPKLEDFKGKPYTNKRHPNFNGGFALGFVYNYASGNNDKTLVCYKDINITGSDYNGIQMKVLSKDISLRNGNNRISLWYEKDDSKYYKTGKYYEENSDLLDQIEQSLHFIEEVSDVAFDFNIEPEIYCGFAGSGINEIMVYMQEIQNPIDHITLHEETHWLPIFYSKALDNEGFWINHSNVNLVSNLVFNKMNNIKYDPLVFNYDYYFNWYSPEYDIPFSVYSKTNKIIKKNNNDHWFFLDYTKSNLFLTSIYQQIGHKNYQKVCRYLKESKIDLSYTNYIETFEKVTGKDLSHMKPGWIDDKPYLKGWGMADIFSDADGDGLRDIEENTFGTNINKIDTDNDGYSDYFEILNKYDPLDKKSPGFINEIKIDGIIDDFIKIGSKEIKKFSDRENDQTIKTGFDIKDLYSFCDDNYLYVAVSFFNSIRSFNKLFYIGINDNLIFYFNNQGLYGILKKINNNWIGESVSYKAKSQIIGITTNNGGEYKIPISNLNNSSTYKIYYKTIEIDEKNNWIESDISKIVIKSKKFNEDDILIDGDIKDFLSKGKNIKTIIDKEKDGKAEKYIDIKKLHAFIKDDYIYVGAEYYSQNVEYNKSSIVLIISSYGKTKFDYWFQLNLVNDWHIFLKYKEEDQNKITIEKSQYQYDLFHNNETEWKIPMSIFEDSYKIEIKLISAYDNNWDADTTQYLVFGTTKKSNDEILIDGDIDDFLSQSINLVSLKDPQNDTQANDGYDIKNLYSFIKDDYLYIGSDYYNIPSNLDNISQTLIITCYGKEKINYLFQTPTLRGWYLFQKYKDGQEKKDTISKKDLKYEIAFDKSGEWKLPLSIFGDAKKIVIKYITNSKDKWDNDTATIVVKNSNFSDKEVLIDGNIEDFKKIFINDFNLIEDESNEGIGYDIKNLYACVKGNYLYIASDYFKIPFDGKSYTHTLHIQNRETKENWWIQGSEETIWAILTFPDNTPVEKWKKIDIPQDIECFISKDGEWKIPLLIFKNNSKLYIRYIAGGNDKDNKQNWYYDETNWLEVDSVNR